MQAEVLKGLIPIRHRCDGCVKQHVTVGGCSQSAMYQIQMTLQRQAMPKRSHTRCRPGFHQITPTISKNTEKRDYVNLRDLLPQKPTMDDSAFTELEEQGIVVVTQVQPQKRLPNGEKKISPHGMRAWVVSNTAQVCPQMTRNGPKMKVGNYFPFSYTKKCTWKGCGYLHVCYDCGEGHSQVSCPKKYQLLHARTHSTLLLRVWLGPLRDHLQFIIITWVNPQCVGLRFTMYQSVTMLLNWHKLTLVGPNIGMLTSTKEGMKGGTRIWQGC